MMSKILYNKKLSEDFFLISAECNDNVKYGQFYMLRAWNTYPVLSRPVSVYDCDGKNVVFLYKVVGEGTEIFSRLQAGDEITLQGPYGNGFPEASGKVALVGGGVGIAPLFFTAKRLKQSGCKVESFLGFSGKAILTDEYKHVSDRIMIDVGGFITDKVEPRNYDYIFTCGPEIMMRVLYKKCVGQDVTEKLYVSMENRMACGIGACLVCSCKTAGGNRKACKDGPVFKGEAVFGI